MDEKPYSLRFQNLVRFARAFGAVGGDPDVKSLSLPHDLRQRAHGLFQRHLGPWPMRVEDVHVVKTHALQALIQRSDEVLLRRPDAVRSGPHIPARLGRDDEFIAVLPEVLPQDFAEVLLRRSVGRSVVIGEIEVGHATVEGTTHYGAARLEDIGTAEVLPQP